MILRLFLAALGTLIVLLSAILPSLLFAASLVATGGRVNGFVILAGIMVTTLWIAAVSVPLRALERYTSGPKGQAVRASIGAVLGFLAGFWLRDRLFVTDANSDYPGLAHGLLYGVTLLGALVAVGASQIKGEGSGPQERAA